MNKQLKVEMFTAKSDIPILECYTSIETKRNEVNNLDYAAAKLHIRNKNEIFISYEVRI